MSRPRRAGQGGGANLASSTRQARRPWYAERIPHHPVCRCALPGAITAPQCCCARGSPWPRGRWADARQLSCGRPGVSPRRCPRRARQRVSGSNTGQLLPKRRDRRACELGTQGSSAQSCSVAFWEWRGDDYGAHGCRQKNRNAELRCHLERHSVSCGHRSFAPPSRPVRCKCCDRTGGGDHHRHRCGRAVEPREAAEGIVRAVQRQSRWMSATIRMDDAGFGRRLGVAQP